MIRAVVDCPASADPEADVGVSIGSDAEGYVPGEPLTYTVVVDNAGPDAAPGTTVVDVFPPQLTGPEWVCTPSGGASCPAAGTGNIMHNVDLPAGSAVTYEITALVAPDASGTISHSVSAVTAGNVIDPELDNNTATLSLDMLPPGKDDTIFADGFDGEPPPP